MRHRHLRAHRHCRKDFSTRCLALYLPKILSVSILEKTQLSCAVRADSHRHSIRLTQSYHTGIEWHLLNLMGMAITSQAERAQWWEEFDLRQPSSCTATVHPITPSAAAWLGSRDGLPAVWLQRLPGAIEGGRKTPGNYVGRPAVAAPHQLFLRTPSLPAHTGIQPANWDVAIRWPGSVCEQCLKHRYPPLRRRPAGTRTGKPSGQLTTLIG